MTQNPMTTSPPGMDIVERLERCAIAWRSSRLPPEAPFNSVGLLFKEAAAEITRLQEAKRRALALADERGKEAAELRIRRAAPEWQPIVGVPRDELPGTLIGWCVGTKDHSGATWRREGQAILTLANDGPLGFSSRSIAFARWLLDMDAIDEVTMYRRVPPPPSLPGEERRSMWETPMSGDDHFLMSDQNVFAEQQISARPKTSNADGWQIWLQEYGLDNAAFLAVQIVEAIEEHQRALAREVCGLAEDTAEKYLPTAKLDDIMGAFSRGRIAEAKSIARAINAIMPYSRDPSALKQVASNEVEEQGLRELQAYVTEKLREA